VRLRGAILIANAMPATPLLDMLAQHLAGARIDQSSDSNMELIFTVGLSPRQARLERCVDTFLEAQVRPAATLTLAPSIKQHDANKGEAITQDDAERNEYVFSQPIGQAHFQNYPARDQCASKSSTKKYS